ncbi:MAG: CHC2 zinc finger domain-containing protein [Flavobacteriales bacterium]
MITRSTIDKIYQVAIIEDVIGEFVQLKRSGSAWKGLSPFANERTPSFFVVPSKGIYKDFSSGKG